MVTMSNEFYQIESKIIYSYIQFAASFTPNNAKSKPFKTLILTKITSSIWHHVKSSRKFQLETRPKKMAKTPVGLEPAHVNFPVRGLFLE